MVITLALVAGELTDAGQRRWWAARPLTTDTVAGLLVTVLVVNQLLNDGVMARTLATVDRSPDGAAVPGGALDDAMRQLRSAAAPLLQRLNPGVRDSIQRIGLTAEQ